MRVRLVCYEDVHEWILGKFALKLQEQLQLRGVEVDIVKTADASADVCHHITYWGYERKVSTVETLMVTHIDTLEKEQRLKHQLFSADMGICMSTDTVRKLIGKGLSLQKLCYVNPAHDGLILPRKTVIGITSRLYEDLRKREEMLVELIKDLDPQEFTFSIMGAGWRKIVDQLRQHGMEVEYYETFDNKAYKELIRSLDYYLYFGQDEGSMGFLDAAAAGIATIVTPQGFHLDAPKAITHTFDKLEDLKSIFEHIAFETRRRVNSVTGWTWENYADKHLRLWESLLRRGAMPSDLQLLAKQESITQLGEMTSTVGPEMAQQNLKVLMVLHGAETATKGGPSIRTQITADHLKRLGVIITITSDGYPDPTGFDLIHLFNVWPPESALSTINYLKAFRIPVIFSPIYLELSEFAWAHKAIRLIFEMAKDKKELDNYLNSLATGELAVNGECSADRVRDIVPGYTDMLRMMFSLADSIIFLSDDEKKKLEHRGIFANYSHLVRNGVDTVQFSHPPVPSFPDAYKVHDYVLCVGRLEPRKNQLLLLEALKDTGITIVLIGHNLEPQYAELTKQYGKNLLWIGHLPHGDMLISAYQQARVFVLPSWSEGAPLSALEAAAAGVPLVLSNRSSEYEYFGDLAPYCDPASIISIRSAVLHEYNGYEGQKDRVRKLQELMKEKYSWENTASETLKAYNATLDRFIVKNPTVSDNKHIPNNHPNFIFDVTDCENEINLQWLNVITWAPVWMTRSERLMLYSLIYSIRPERYLEIGVYKGGSTLITCAALDSLGAAGKMFCVDIERQVDPEHWDKVKHRAELILGASPGILPDVVSMAGGTFDFALVDGDHRYESVIRDAEGIAPYISPGGHILFHDAYNNDVGKAIEYFVCRHTDDFYDLGFITREITKGTSTEGIPAQWGGLRLVQKKQTRAGQPPSQVIEGCHFSRSSKSLMAPSCDSTSIKSIPKKISVLYDISALGLSTRSDGCRTGIFRVVERLAQGLAKSPDIMLSFCSTQSFMEHAPYAADACRQYLAMHPEFGHIAFHGSNIPEADIFHSPFHGLPDVITTPIRFITVYDLIPVLFPQFVPQHSVQLQYRMFRMLKPQDRCLCISEATKDDLCRFTGMPPEMAYVSHLAADSDIFHPCTDNQQQQAVRQKYNIGKVPYILSLCTLEPRKNIDHVIRALGRLVRNGLAGDTRLVLTGTRGWDFDRIFSEIDNNPDLNSRIVLTGYVPDDDLSSLYSGATAFVYMSLYEGFGLPPLEAMQCGVPVITSNTSSLPEVVGDAGILLDPDDQEGLCNAIQELQQNQSLRRLLSTKSIKQASKFSWDAYVRQTIDAYKSALRKRTYYKRPVTIGIDARTFCYSDSVVRGIGHYSRYHLLAIAQQKNDWRFICYSAFNDIPPALEELALLPNISFRQIDEFKPDQVDIIHICDPMSLQIGFDSPLMLFKGSKHTTVTFYDLTPLHLYFSSWSELQRTHYRLRLEQFVKSDSTLLAISAFTRTDLIRETVIDPERVKIIMAGLNTSLSCTRPTHLQVMEVFNRLGISKPFYLHVGALDPHKNFDASAMAFIACREHTSARLVVVGEKTGHLAGYANYCAAKGIKDIVFTGFISREDLEVLYQEAVALLFMSKFEGFGFPVLEAMAKGCPVITSNVTSIPEIAGDAAIILSPDDTVGIRNAMLDLLVNPERAEELRRRGLKQADKFTWQKTAEKTIAVWEEMLSGKVMPQSINTTVISPSQPSAARSIEHIRVLLDISVLGLGYYDETSRTGVFRVVEHLARGLAAAHEIELHFCVTQPLSENAPQTETACKEYLVQHPEFGHIPFHGMNIPLTDVFHSPFHPLPPQVNIPLRFLTIYDLIPIIYPGLYQGRYNPVPQILASLSSGDRMLCISQATKDDLCRVTGIVQERSTVTHLAADPAIFYPCTDKKQQAVRQKYNMGNAPYILSLCTLEPRKNIDHVLRAFARLVRDGRAAETRLVLTGTKGWDFNRIFSEIDNNPELHTRIVLTGYVPDDDLAPLYSGATAFVYMSLYEGFGLPPLEAMQCGVPVITSNTSSLPEVVGDAGIMLDPQDMDGLCRAMHEVITNHELHTKMSKRSLLQAAHFSWDRCVEETIAAYKNALNEKEGKVGAVREPTIVIDGVIFQLQHGRPFGISRLWWSLLTELAATPLAERIVLLDREGTAPEIPGIRRRKMSAFCLGNARNEASMLDQVCREEGGGLFVSTYYTYTLSTPSLLMLYDMIPERFQTVGPDATNPEWRDKHHAIENSSSFAAISQSTARDLALFYPQVATRPQTVIPCAVSDAFRLHSKDEIAAFKTAGGFSKRYFLLVGRHDAHKNVRLFFQAFAQLPDRERYAIVMAGAGNELEPELRELIAGADDYASFFSDQDLALLYSGALALVYPSIYEGFGLPILEAMQSGCPVITCHNSSIFEVAGRAALYVGESDVDGLAKTLLDVQQPDVRSYLIQAGLEEAQRFSWKKSADLLAATINAQL